MNIKEYYFQDVTLLVTHFNRSKSLGRLLAAFRDMGFRFGDILVSDDGSDAEQFERVKQLQSEFSFTLITSPVNKGLGDNINKGQLAVKTPFTLYVQEDFVPLPKFADKFAEALDIMKKENKWDIIRFYAYGAYPYLKTYGQGFSEMVWNPWNFKSAKIHMYSDHPHLRRSDFLEKFGKYAVGLKPQKTEYIMVMSYIQKKGKGLFYDEYQSLFEQRNSSEEPSTWQQKDWKQSKNPWITWIRNIYRQLKYNFDIHFLNTGRN